MFTSGSVQATFTHSRVFSEEEEKCRVSEASGFDDLEKVS